MKETILPTEMNEKDYHFYQKNLKIEAYYLWFIYLEKIVMWIEMNKTKE